MNKEIYVVLSILFIFLCLFSMNSSTSSINTSSTTKIAIHTLSQDLTIIRL